MFHPRASSVVPHLVAVNSSSDAAEFLTLVSTLTSCRLIQQVYQELRGSICVGVVWN